MNRRMSSIRPLLLALLLAMPSALAQEQQISARVLFEKAAYAEEHEGDLAKAESLYAEAVAKAKAAGDAPLAAQSEAARQVVLVKQGKAPPRILGEDSAKLQLARRYLTLMRQMEAAGKRYTDRHPQMQRLRLELQALARENAPDRTVATLEAVMKGEAPDPGSVATDNEATAAQALATLELEEADAALQRGLRSPKEFVRLAAAGAADPERHRAMLEAAVRDPSMPVAEAAWSRLATLRDPSLLPLQREAARRGVASAIFAEIERNPGEFLSWLSDPTLSKEGRREAIRVLRNHNLSQSAKSEVLPQVLAVIESGRDEATTADAWIILQNLTAWRDAFSPQLRERAEKLAIREFASDDAASETRTAARKVLELVGTVRTAEALAERASPPALPDIERLFTQSVWRGGPDDLPRMVRLASEFYGRNSEWQRRFAGDLTSAVSVQPFSEAAVAETLSSLEGPWRDAFLRAITKAPANAAYLPAYREALRPGAPPEASTQACAALVSYSLPPRTWAESFLEAMREHLRQGREGESAPQIPFIHEKEAQAALASAILALDREAGERAIVEFERLFNNETWKRFVLRAPDKPFATTADWIAYRTDVIDRLWATSRRDWSKSMIAAAVSAEFKEAAFDSWLAERWEFVQTNSRPMLLERFARNLYQPAVPVIGKALDDPAENVRTAARKALDAFLEHRKAKAEFDEWLAGDQQARDSIGELMKLLESPKRDVVEGAVRALGAVKAKAALPALVRLLERDDAALKQAVNDAIARIGG